MIGIDRTQSAEWRGFSIFDAHIQRFVNSVTLSCFLIINLVKILKLPRTSGSVSSEAVLSVEQFPEYLGC